MSHQPDFKIKDDSRSMEMEDEEDTSLDGSGAKFRSVILPGGGQQKAQAAETTSAW